MLSRCIFVNGSSVWGKCCCVGFSDVREFCTNKWALAFPSLPLFHLKTRISHNNQTLFVLIDFRWKEGEATMFCWCFDNIMCYGWRRIRWRVDAPDILASLQKNWNFYNCPTAFSAPQYDENITCTFPNLLMTQSRSNHSPGSPRRPRSRRLGAAHLGSGPGTLAPAPANEFCWWVSSLQTLGRQCQDYL